MSIFKIESVFNIESLNIKESSRIVSENELISIVSFVDFDLFLLKNTAAIIHIPIKTTNLIMLLLLVLGFNSGVNSFFSSDIVINIR